MKDLADPRSSRRESAQDRAGRGAAAPPREEVADGADGKRRADSGAAGGGLSHGHGHAGRRCLGPFAKAGALQGQRLACGHQQRAGHASEGKGRCSRPPRAACARGSRGQGGGAEPRRGPTCRGSALPLDGFTLRPRLCFILLLFVSVGLLHPLQKPPLTLPRGGRPLPDRGKEGFCSATPPASSRGA